MQGPQRVDTGCVGNRTHLKLFFHATFGRSLSGHRSQGSCAPLNGLDTLRIRSEEPPKKDEKECDFQCGVDNQMPDDFSIVAECISPDFLGMRWAYPNSSGAVCESVWQTELSHHRVGKKSTIPLAPTTWC